jgi:hypothetical protein
MKLFEYCVKLSVCKELALKNVISYLALIINHLIITNFCTELLISVYIDTIFFLSVACFTCIQVCFISALTKFIYIYIHTSTSAINFLEQTV